jgi:uncharacterized protein YbbC (DUF1343 family)/CubicO group peptidase (beta-lactamase class C family)
VLWTGDLLYNCQTGAVGFQCDGPPKIAIPHVAFTWYVLIGAAVTFAVGMVASVGLKQRKAVAVVLFGLVMAGSLVAQEGGSVSRGLKPVSGQVLMSGLKPGPISEAKTNTSTDFSAVSAAIDGAIAAKKLPGAVVVVGHGGKVVFEQAYGVRKLDGEPGVDGRASPAEPMTVDTIFDMASLTKCLATATAVMQLVEQGKVDVDAPVVKYLPEFGVNGKDKVTVRELLTHYSGLPPDVDLKDAWGLAKPDKAEGMKRAMAAKLDSVPGTKFVYSDVNFITLGAIVEKVSGEALDVYTREHVFEPLRMMHTQFHPFSKTCGPAERIGSAVYAGPKPVGRILVTCARGTWGPYGLDPMTAPTQHDNEGTAETNPDFDHLLRGTVHDPTTRRMGGVAGHAGVFSTAGDVALFAQALLDRLAGRPSDFPLKRETVERMTTPEQPKTALGGATIFNQDGKTTTPDGKAVTGVALRGFGWDINSAFSRPRGEIFQTVMSTGEAAKTQPSFGHTGFTGTSLWMDPASDSYVILLANSVHPRGRAPISPLRGEVATTAALALNVCYFNDCAGSVSLFPQEIETISTPFVGTIGGTAQVSEARPRVPGSTAGTRVLTGIDVLEASGFAALKEAAGRHGGKLRIGLLTNQTGLDAQGKRTIDVLRGAGNGIELVKLFSPEHGIFGAKDSEVIGQEVDAASGLKVTSLYGPKDADKRPKPEDLKDLDAVVIDLQDAGVRFYTYETVVGYFLEAAACQKYSGNELEVIVLDRPDPIGGLAVEGPISDYATNSYINYMEEPVRLGMTLGELAHYFATMKGVVCRTGASAPSQTAATTPTTPAVAMSETTPARVPDEDHPTQGPDPLKRRLADKERIAQNKNLSYDSAVNLTYDRAKLTVVPMQGWTRGEFFDQTGVKWVNPSPNLRSVEEATLYPGVGMMDATNMSVGRGTAMPFEVFGAGVTAATASAPAGTQWFDGKAVAEYLTARKIAGVSFGATRFAVAEDANKYPYHGQTIEGVRMKVTDRALLNSPEMGIEIVAALHHLYPAQFKLEKVAGLVANSETMAGLERGDDPRVIAAGWEAELKRFEERREKYLIYK